MRQRTIQAREEVSWFCPLSLDYSSHYTQECNGSHDRIHLASFRLDSLQEDEPDKKEK